MQIHLKIFKFGEISYFQSSNLACQANMVSNFCHAIQITQLKMIHLGGYNNVLFAHTLMQLAACDKFHNIIVTSPIMKQQQCKHVS